MILRQLVITQTWKKSDAWQSRWSEYAASYSSTESLYDKGS